MLRAVAVRRLYAGLLILGIIGMAGQAHADWALIAVSGGERLTQRVAERAEAALRSAEFDIVSRDSAEAVGVTVRDLARCVGEAPECMKNTLAAVEVDRLVLFVIERDRPRRKRRAALDATIEVILYDGDTGRVLGSEEARCEGCGEGDVDRTVDGLIAAVVEVDEPEPEPEPETQIRVTTEPPGAAVTIDGREVGASGAAYPVDPGEHTVRATLEGYEAAEQDIEVTPGATASVDLTLIARSAPRPPEPRGYGAWKWAALGSGAGLAALGVFGIAIDGPRFDDTGARQPDAWNTFGPGVAATLVGVGLVGVSGYMFYRDASRPAAESRPGITLQRRGRGMVVSWSRRF